MISPSNIDTDKARLLLSHLGRASKKVSEKAEARQKLAEQVKKLKKVSKAKNHKKEMKELEKRLADVLEKEKDILRHQKTRAITNRRVRGKIAELEKRLTKYLATKGQRERRIDEIDEKIRKRFKTEQREIEMLAQQMISLERLYEKISKEKKYTKSELERVRKRIERIKERLGKVK